MDKNENNLSTFEKDLKSMQSLLDDIESKDLSLDEIIEKYKLGIELSKKCQKPLKKRNRKSKKYQINRKVNLWLKIIKY